MANSKDPVKKITKAKSTISVNSESKKAVNFKVPFRVKFPGKVTEKTTDHIAFLLLQWINSSEEIYVFKEFLYFQQTVHDTYMDWVHKYPRLEKAHILALQKIGFNREREALKKNPEGVAFKHMQGTYDPQWVEREKFLSELNKKSDQQELSSEQLLAMLSKILQPVNNSSVGNDDKSN